jgi:hypothetical protein
MTGSPDNTGTTAIGVCQSRARLSKDWILGDSFRHADLNEAASAADASRDTIWQGNCDVGHQQLCNNIAPIRNTIPIQYPISNCPAKKGFLQVAVSKARRAAVSPDPPPDFRRRASDTALRLLRPNPLAVLSIA